MTYYRCYFLGSGGALRYGEWLRSATRNEAIDTARHLLAAKAHYEGFEIWERARLIHMERAGAKDAADERRASSMERSSVLFD